MRILTPSLVLLAMTAACTGDQPPPPAVTGPVHHVEVALARAGDDLARDAVDYATAALALEGDDQLVAGVVRIGLDGLRHARLQQEHNGVPVFGAEVMVHADDTTFLGFNGTITTGLDGFDIVPSVYLADATAIVSHQEEVRGPLGDVRASSQLVILPRDLEGEGADLAWQIELVDAGWTFFVGAETGAVLRKYSAHHPIEQASGPGGNPRVAWTWDARLDVEPDGGEYIMQTDRLLTLDHSNGDMVVHGPLDNMPDPAANDAHGFAEVTLDMLRDWFGANSIDDKGLQIISIVNHPNVCGYGPDNACWNGSQMQYGTGATSFYALSSGIDVVSHEIHHGYTQHHSGLVYDGMAGGLNESFSDIAGTAAEYFHQGDPADFLIGEDVTRSGDPLRDMRFPILYGQIDHMNNYERHLGTDGNGNPEVQDHEVHGSSGIGNKAFVMAWDRFRVINVGSTADIVRRVAHAWYVANDSRWGSDTTFTQACQGVVDGALALGYSSDEVVAIAQSWADVGVFCNSGDVVCVEDGRCDLAAGETCAGCPSDCDTCAEDCGRYKKGKCKLGMGDCSRCGDPGCGDGICDEDEDDQNCGQDCGCAAPGSPCESVAPFGCYCDQFCEDEGDCCADKQAVCGG